MNPHRAAPPQPRLVPRAPLYRLAWAWARGVFRRLERAQVRRAAEYLRRRRIKVAIRLPHNASHSEARHAYGLAMIYGVDVVFEDAPAPKGPGPRPANLPE